MNSNLVIKSIDVGSMFLMDLSVHDETGLDADISNDTSNGKSSYDMDKNNIANRLSSKFGETKSSLISSSTGSSARSSSTSSPVTSSPTSMLMSATATHRIPSEIRTNNSNDIMINKGISTLAPATTLGPSPQQQHLFDLYSQDNNCNEDYLSTTLDRLVNAIKETYSHDYRHHRTYDYLSDGRTKATFMSYHDDDEDDYEYGNENDDGASDDENHHGLHNYLVDEDRDVGDDEEEEDDGDDDSNNLVERHRIGVMHRGAGSASGFYNRSGAAAARDMFRQDQLLIGR